MVLFNYWTTPKCMWGHKLITTIKITDKLIANRANEILCHVRDFKSGLIFIWINSFTRRISSKWNWMEMFIFCSAILYFLFFDFVPDIFSSIDQIKYKRKMFVCRLDSFVYIGLLIFIIGRTNSRCCFLFFDEMYVWVYCHFRKVVQKCFVSVNFCLIGFLWFFFLLCCGMNKDQSIKESTMFIQTIT